MTRPMAGAIDLRRDAPRRVHPRDWATFASIGAVWGSSFLLFAIALNAFEPIDEVLSFALDGSATAATDGATAPDVAA
jgi:hypothetical protein